MAGGVFLGSTEPDAARVLKLVGVAGVKRREATSSLLTSSQMTSSMEVVTDEVGDEPAGVLAALGSVSPSHVLFPDRLQRIRAVAAPALASLKR